MSSRNEREAMIVRVTPDLDDLRSNVTACSNVFPRLGDVLEPERDVAFRCRVRGAMAVRNIVPPGIIDVVSGRHEIRELAEIHRVAAFGGTLNDVTFTLLPEQVAELSAFTCIKCRRSTVSVWFDGRKVRQQFVLRCMCQRTGEQEDKK